MALRLAPAGLGAIICNDFPGVFESYQQPLRKQNMVRRFKKTEKWNFKPTFFPPPAELQSDIRPEGAKLPKSDFKN